MSTPEVGLDAIQAADLSVSTDSKSAHFEAIHRGDCTIEDGATYTIFSDGSTRWVCDITSPNNEDAWLGFF